MNPRSTRALLAGLAGVIMAISALGVLGGTARGEAIGPPDLTGAPPPVVPAPVQSLPPPAGGVSDLASAMAESALAATRAAGLSPHLVYVPRPSASPGQVRFAASQGHVSPLYSGDPAPVGLADYGLSAGPGNTVTASYLNTTSVRAEVDLNATGVQPLDLFQSTPDSYGIQLNAVVTNVTLFGVPGYSFWTQNVVTFDPATHYMVLVTNVWNFSGGPLSPNVFYSHGVHGQQVGTYYYYAELVVAKPVSYPFNLVLFLNSTLQNGRDEVVFSVALSGPGERFARSYDDVVFNSIGRSGPSLAVPANFTVDGVTYNPIGLTDDFELIFGGPGGGSQADLFAADASLALEYKNGGSYVPVPSAFDYGGETGETVTGASVAWASGPGGPNAAGTYGLMTTGPSVLRGLWNATGPVGSHAVTLLENPSNAFNFVTELGGSPAFVVAEPTYAPNVFTDAFWLTPGNYSITTELSDYDAVTTNLTVSALGGDQTFRINLTSDPTRGIYTPLWAFSNAQVPAISSGGMGTPTQPFVLDRNQYDPLGASFGLYNDYTFPVFPGVFLMGTTVPTQLNHPSNFSTATDTFQSPGPNLSAVNDLQMWFWNVTNVSIVNAADLGGWFGAGAYYPLTFDTFNVIFYESSGNLIAHDDFQTQSQALLLFSGGTPIGNGSLNVGGGNNTVWGNTFQSVAAPTGCPVAPTAPPCEALLPGADGLGLEVAEQPDLIYNNNFSTPTTAWEPPINLYTGYGDLFSENVWNVSLQPATNTHTAPNFPSFPLTGSILNLSWQGGNFWWDYGLASNPVNGANDPYGILPYDENATTPIVQILGASYYHASYIYPGGDRQPLVRSTLYGVKLDVSGRTKETSRWRATIAPAGSSSPLLDNFATTASSHTVVLPNGSYRFTALPPYHTAASLSGIVFTVSGANSTVTVKLALGSGTGVLTFKEKGLPSGASWGVTINGTDLGTWGSNQSQSTTSGTESFDVADGSYNYTVGPVPGEKPVHASGTMQVRGSTKVVITFHVREFTLTFTETGLKAKKSWKVTVGSKSIRSSHPTIVFNLPNGTYSYSIKPIRGMNVSVQNPITNATSGWKGSVLIAGSNTSRFATFSPVTYVVSFAESGLATNAPWSVAIQGKTYNTTGAFINVTLPNGSFHYRITTTSGSRAKPSTGTVRVRGAGERTRIVFTPPAGHFPAAPRLALPADPRALGFRPSLVGR